MSEAVVESAINMMAALTKEYGPEEGMQLWDTIRDTLPQDVVNGMLVQFLTVAHNPRSIKLGQFTNNNKVEGIKAIRSVTGYGLKEALDTFNAMPIEIRLSEHVDYQYAVFTLKGAGFNIA